MSSLIGTTTFAMLPNHTYVKSHVEKILPVMLMLFFLISRLLDQEAVFGQTLTSSKARAKEAIIGPLIGEITDLKPLASLEAIG